LSGTQTIISVQCLVEGTRSHSDRLVRFLPSQSVEQFHEARFIRITRAAFAVWPDPFGVLDAEVVVNLSPKLDVSADFVRNGNCKDSCVVRDGSHQRLGGTGDKPWCRECATAKQGYSKRRHTLACGVRDVGPTRSLCSAGVAATGRAARSAQGSTCVLS
jgi:hypothetical protein